VHSIATATHGAEEQLAAWERSSPSSIPGRGKGFFNLSAPSSAKAAVSFTPDETAMSREFKLI